MNNTFAIDLGTNNIKIYNAATDKIMVQKNMIAIENKKNMIAFGDSAYEMYEKSPANIRVSGPITNGVIADINNMERLIKSFITYENKGAVRAADYFIAVPTDVTEVERRAFYDLPNCQSQLTRQLVVGSYREESRKIGLGQHQQYEDDRRIEGLVILSAYLQYDSLEKPLTVFLHSAENSDNEEQRIRFKSLIHRALQVRVYHDPKYLSYLGELSLAHPDVGVFSVGIFKPLSRL